MPAALSNLSELTRSGFTFRTRGDRTGLELVIVPSTLFSGDRKGTAAAEFIYDRIGLVLLGRSAESLPTAPVMRTRRLVSPIPMEFSTRFAVKASGSGTITLDVFGSVATSQPATAVKLVGGTAAVSLKGGYAFGDMTVDEHNCVPRRADWNRYVDSSWVKTGAGDRIEQQKHEVVTIRGIEANDPKNVPDQPTVAPAAASASRAAGLSPLMAPSDAPWGERYFHIDDPSGHQIANAKPLPQKSPHAAVAGLLRRYCRRVSSVLPRGSG